MIRAEVFAAQFRGLVSFGSYFKVLCNLHHSNEMLNYSVISNDADLTGLDIVIFPVAGFARSSHGKFRFRAGSIGNVVYGSNTTR